MRFRSRVLVQWAAFCGFAAGGAALAADAAPAFTDGQLVAALHRVNRMEIDAARMAQKNAAGKPVKRFARMLARDHRRADRDLGSYARDRHLGLAATLPAGMTGELTAARTRLSNLQALHGSVFDEDFANLMVRDHQRAITLVRRGRAQASDPRLKTMLGQLARQAREHERAAASLAHTTAAVSAAAVTLPAQARRGHRR